MEKKKKRRIILHFKTVLQGVEGFYDVSLLSVWVMGRRFEIEAKGSLSFRTCIGPRMVCDDAFPHIDTPGRRRSAIKEVLGFE